MPYLCSVTLKRAIFMQQSKKFSLDLELIENSRLNSQYVLLKFKSGDPLPEMRPGQFVQVKVDHSATTYLRRPISINFVETIKNEIWLLVQTIGDGTRAMGNLAVGDYVNMLLPLGNGFSFPSSEEKVLLVGGGVGVAPLLMLGKQIRETGKPVTFLLGARSAKDLLELELFGKYGDVLTTTEDGSHGQKGFVTQHIVFQNSSFNRIYTCGPRPMMQAVAEYASKNGIECEVSLENTMACGIGACLCCVEDTVDGHICTCTEGPVFNSKQLKW
jgi:dihydroorotate dehydrogenase electron transfer subunit